MTVEKFNKSFSAVEALREKVLILKENHPLYSYYKKLVAKFNKLTPEEYKKLHQSYMRGCI